MVGILMIYFKEIIWFLMLLQKNNNKKDHGRYSMGRNHTIYQDMIYGYFVLKKEKDKLKAALHRSDILGNSKVKEENPEVFIH